MAPNHHAGCDGMSERTCIVTRQPLDSGQLIRFVLAPEGNVMADLNRKLPGRGVWVTAQKQFVARAVEKKLFSRGFKTQANAANDLADEVERQLRKAALGSLAMARKAGLIITGFDKVEAGIRSGKVEMVMHALEAAPDGIRKLAQAIKSAGAGDKNVTAVKQIFTSAQMDLALGADNVIHAAAKHGGATTALRCRMEFLERYCS